MGVKLKSNRFRIKFNNYSMLVGKKQGDDWYDWCVFVDDTPGLVSQIRSVEYALHRSFPDPVRVRKDKNLRFALLSSGWGEFNLRIKVELETGENLPLAYGLRLLADDWPKKAPPRTWPNEETQGVYECLIQEHHRWRKPETISRMTGIAIERIHAVLQSLATENYTRRADSLSIDGQELWGATSIVGIIPRLPKL